MNSLPQKLAKAIFTLVVIAFFSVSFFGISHFNMATGMDGKMSPCPFATGMSVCNMSPFEHIAAWQSMFTSLPRQQQDIGAFLFLLLVSFLAFGWTRYIYPPPKNLLRSFQHSRYQKYVPLGGFLQEAFSDGILNPKVY